jgi:single-stranded-DNA-specific exonuclease
MTLRIVRRSSPQPAADLGSALHPVLRRVYGARGLRAASELSLTLDRLLPVGTLGGVEAAVDLLLQHRQRGTLILVIGDFDADGATSTALIVRALRAWGYQAVDFLVPNRFEFGYGLTPEIVALAAARRPGLIITVDNGISSIAGVAAARRLGIDVLVTDHHLPGAELPAANAIVNPNVPGNGFATGTLAGVGVAFYVMAALRRRLDELGCAPPAAPGVAEFLDLVALGTVADLVPLDVNNRVLVAQGLARIRAGRCVAGIRALLELAGKRLGDVSAADLGFVVAPRLNAAGRLDDMSYGIRCLLADSAAEANALAAHLDQLNRERRTIEARMQDEALLAVRALRDAAALGVGASTRTGAARIRRGVCLYDPGWHQGVVGLVASRVKDKLRRPVIAFADAGEGWLRGSARSVPGVHIRDVLDAIAARHPELISKFGGHAMAAGLTLAAASLDEFADEFDAEVRRWLAGADDANLIESDGELAVEEIALETAEALRAGGPWGQAFPEPVFDGVFEVRSSRVVGDKHLKLWLEVPGTGRSFDAIAFNLLEPGQRAPLESATQAQFVYRLDINEYQGERRLQLLVDHVLAWPPVS